ncbi:hypothetical protein ACVWXO_002811 [Bradyrhizobium sp. LM2.7]
MVDIADAVTDGEIDRRRRQRDVERHVIVVRGERLQVRTDLVADVPIGGNAVGADDGEIDHAVLHQMPARVVRNHRVRHAVMTELPRRERGALVARAGLVDPDVDLDAALMRQIDRRGRRAPVDGGEPTGVAMGERVDHFAGLLRRNRLDQRKAIAGDTAVDLDILLGDLSSARA